VFDFYSLNLPTTDLFYPGRLSKQSGEYPMASVGLIAYRKSQSLKKRKQIIMAKMSGK
jgi:hypothetical protein